MPCYGQRKIELTRSSLLMPLMRSFSKLKRITDVFLQVADLVISSADCFQLTKQILGTQDIKHILVSCCIVEVDKGVQSITLSCNCFAAFKQVTQLFNVKFVQERRGPPHVKGYYYQAVSQNTGQD